MLLTYLVKVSSSNLVLNRLASDLLALSQAIHSLLEILLQESLAYQTGANAYLPGHTMLSESSGRLFASCWIWYVDKLASRPCG